MKPQILAALRSGSGHVSGEAISGMLGISRVAVWKHIRKLKEYGYQIEPDTKGYRLKASPDALYSWEFPGREQLVHYFHEVASTMDEARKLARNGCSHMTVVVADRQSKGRGRLKRPWDSDTGGLYFSLILRPESTPAETPRIGLATALALVDTLDRCLAVDARLKWPNDVLVGEMKVAGILSEMEAEADRVGFVNVGIGLNVNNPPPSIQPPAVSLKQVVGHSVERRPILIEFLDRLEVFLAPERLAQVAREWKNHTVTLGRFVRVQTLRETFEGRAIDVDENGALVLETADGKLKTVYYGDCFHM